MLPTAQDLQELLDKVTYSVDTPVQVRLTMAGDMQVKAELLGQNGHGRIAFLPIDLLSLATHREWPGVFLYQTSQQVDRVLRDWLHDCLRVNGRVI